MRSRPIEELIAACAAGDHAALRAIYDREAGSMLAVAQRIVKRRDLAEEVVHDAFLRIWAAAGRFNGAAGLGRAWIYTILRNRALSVLRGESRHELTDDFESFALESPEASPEELMTRLSDDHALKRCLAMLDRARQHILLLAYTEGLSHGEIANRLNLPLGTVKSWVRRSLLSLRECMG
jgi:RNA polymerase sigma-70 factor (ECF subfamily)